MVSSKMMLRGEGRNQWVGWVVLEEGNTVENRGALRMYLGYRSALVSSQTETNRSKIRLAV